MPHNQPSRPRQSHSDLPLPRQTATDTRTDPLISALRVSAATAGMPGTCPVLLLPPHKLVLSAPSHSVRNNNECRGIS
jgi:hypothetical protein